LVLHLITKDYDPQLYIERRKAMAEMSATQNPGKKLPEMKNTPSVKGISSPPPKQPMDNNTSSEKAPIKKSIKTTKGPVGLDIGTSHIVVATQDDGNVNVTSELNAFYAVEATRMIVNTFKAQKIPFFEYEGQCYTMGYASQHFANIFHKSLRRPIYGGIVSPNEEEGIKVIQNIIDTVLPKPENFSETLCFGVPGDPLEGTGSVVFHTEVIKRFIGGLGYKPIPINEAMAVIMSELENESYTGIGISCGGGMCNVCLSYLSVPVISFSIRKSGDFINQKAAESVGESETKMKLIKEEELDLAQRAPDRYHMALHIFYDDMITFLISSIRNVISQSSRMPTISHPIPIVLSGGTVMPNGFLNKFNKLLKQNPLPIEISNVKIADKPLETTARGALKVAIAEKEGA